MYLAHRCFLLGRRLQTDDSSPDDSLSDKLADSPTDLIANVGKRVLLCAIVGGSSCCAFRFGISIGISLDTSLLGSSFRVAVVANLCALLPLLSIITCVFTAYSSRRFLFDASKACTDLFSSSFQHVI